MEEADKRVSRETEMHKGVTERSPSKSVFSRGLSQPSARRFYAAIPQAVG